MLLRTRFQSPKADSTVPTLEKKRPQTAHSTAWPAHPPRDWGAKTASVSSEERFIGTGGGSRKECAHKATGHTRQRVAGSRDRQLLRFLRQQGTTNKKSLTCQNVLTEQTVPGAK